MNETEVRESVARSIGNVLARAVAPSECVRRDTEARWDSLSHAMIMFSVEDAFDIKFTEAELQNLKTSEEIVDTVIRHLEPRHKSRRAGL
jgi:acyl carrier protein